MYYTLKFFGACGGLLVLPLEFFQRLRRAAVLHIKISSDCDGLLHQYTRHIQIHQRIVESRNLCDTMLENDAGKKFEPTKILTLSHGLVVVISHRLGKNILGSLAVSQK